MVYFNEFTGCDWLHIIICNSSSYFQLEDWLQWFFGFELFSKFSGTFFPGYVVSLYNSISLLVATGCTS